MNTPFEDLQIAVLNALLANPAVQAVVGDRISDGLPKGFPCITFGASDYVPLDLDGIDLREQALQLHCWVRDGEKIWPTAALADKVKAALHLAELQLSAHALVILKVESVRAFMDPDGLTGHAIVSVEAEIEER